MCIHSVCKFHNEFPHLSHIQVLPHNVVINALIWSTVLTKALHYEVLHWISVLRMYLIQCFSVAGVFLPSTTNCGNHVILTRLINVIDIYWTNVH